MTICFSFLKNHYKQSSIHPCLSGPAGDGETGSQAAGVALGSLDAWKGVLELSYSVAVVPTRVGGGRVEGVVKPRSLKQSLLCTQ